MKIEVGLDDRTLLAIDKLTYALQQMVRPECHYTGAQAATPPAPVVTPTPPVVTPAPPL
jgi:hypothetical protein